MHSEPANRSRTFVDRSHSPRWFAFALILALGCGGDSDRPKGTDFDPEYSARQTEAIDLAITETGDGGPQIQIARALRGIPLQYEKIGDSLDKIRRRPDTSDFDAVRLIRVLFEVGDSLDPERRAEIEQVLIEFKYWVDEPGDDTMIFWSENHQILFAAAEYLMGQRFKDTVFPNAGLTGREHQAKARERILAWTRDRARFGYSEWLSHTYYEEDIAPLLALVDYAEEELIRDVCTAAIDLLVLDMALNSYQGFFGTTHGRSPGQGSKLDATREATAGMQRVLFGHGVFRGLGDWGTIALATSDYRPPRVLVEIARESSTFVTLQRNGIDVEEGPSYGYPFDGGLESAIFYWGMGGYPHYLVAPLTIEIANTYGLYGDGGVFSPFEVVSNFPPNLVAQLADAAAPLAEGALYETANIYTYRMAEGLLSSTRDSDLKGTFGFQQHLWQATFGPRAVVFTTHPGPEEDGGLPFSAGYWEGGSSLPRVAQHENVAIVLYQPRIDTLARGLLRSFFPDFTHAYFPRDEFDETRSESGWHFGRKGDGYIALYSGTPAQWTTSGEWADRELIAPGSTNAWICEVSNARQSGSFDAFIRGIADAFVSTHGPNVAYASPSQGAMEFSWEGPLVLDGQAIEIRNHPRYSNPFTVTPFGADSLVVDHAGSTLEIDLTIPRRVRP